jgi:hypothetical protein
MIVYFFWNGHSSDEYQTSKKYEIAAKINFGIKKRY